MTMRSQVIGLLASALASRLFSELSRRGMNNLGYLLEKAVRYQRRIFSVWIFTKELTSTVWGLWPNRPGWCMCKAPTVLSHLCNAPGPMDWF
jgi:hypothetical protein